MSETFHSRKEKRKLATLIEKSWRDCAYTRSNPVDNCAICGDEIRYSGSRFGDAGRMRRVRHLLKHSLCEMRQHLIAKSMEEL